MNAELKTKLVNALRSGEFKQCQSRLQIEDSFCCLGVACVVAGLGIDADSDRALRPDGTSHENSSYGALDEIGLTSHWRFHLIAMNDKGRPFPEIADYIEQNIPPSEVSDDR